jgi:hypothetical protein
LISGGDIIAGMRVDGPFPEPLDPVAQYAYWWPNVLKDVARTRSYVAVAARWSKRPRLDAHMLHTVLVRELVEQLPVIGVLWDNVPVQADNFKGEFAKMVKGELPIQLWVLIQFSKQPNGNTLISTIGMRKFGKMEIETESSLPFDQTYTIVRYFGAYVITKDTPVNDGDTIGRDEKQRIRVRHMRSFRPDVDENVYWLELTDKPSVQRPGSGAKP